MGNLSFDTLPINEVDGLIFCAFAYFKIESILSYQETVSIKDLYLRYKEIEEDTIFKKNQNRLFKVLSETKRFSNILVTRYFNIVNKQKEMQIAGMTFLLPNEILYVAFKGTDSTIVGWKENLNLSYMEVIPSEQKACSYLDEILQSTKKKVYVGGHSKGGNLGMYASIFCQNEEKIAQVYNYDGPGFSKEILETDAYKKRKDKIITFIPKSSIVGNILNKDTKTLIIKSKQIGLLEHDLYSWLISSTHFVYTKNMSEEAKKMSNLLNEMIENIPDDKKQKMITFFYDVLESWNLEDIEKMLENTFLFQNTIGKYDFQIEDYSLLFRGISLLVEILKSL